MQKDEIQVVVLGAGAGTRFASYPQPKPAILVHGKPMLDYCLEQQGIPKESAFVCLSEASVPYLDRASYRGCLVLDRLTRGPAETASIALSWFQLDPFEPVLFVDCDSFIKRDLRKLIAESITDRDRAAVVAFPNLSSASHFSVVNVDATGNVSIMFERANVRPDWSSCGMYYFSSARLAESAAKSVLNRLNPLKQHECFLSDMINEVAVVSGMRVKALQVETEDFVCLGTPEELESYLHG